MGYDDLKVVEAKKFLVAVTGGEQRNSTIEEALADAAVIAADRRVRRGRAVAQGPAGSGGHLRPRPATRWPAMPEVAELPVVVGLGVVDPDLVNPVLGGHCRFVAGTDRGGPGAGAGRHRPGGCPWWTPSSWPGPRGCGSWPGPESASSGWTWTPPPPAASPWSITPGAGTTAVAEGAIAMAMHLVKRFGRLTTLVRDRPVGDPRHRLGR